MGKTKAKELPPMPDPRPCLTLTVRATLDHDLERYSNGRLRMTQDRCEISKGKKKVGHVDAALPAGVVVNIGGRSYYIGPTELWEAVERAEQEQLR